MAVTRAPETATHGPAQAPEPAPWATLDRRQVGELAVPGAVIGLLGGVIAGGMAAVGGLPPALALVSGVTLGVGLAAVGAFYDILLAKGRVPLGVLAPMAAVWFVGFPLARIVHAGTVNVYAGSSFAVPHGWIDFIVYQFLLSVPFAIGFWWLHENFAPRWWMHIADRNPVAAEFLQVLISSVRQRRARDGRTKGLAGMQERRLRRRKR